MRKCSFDGCTRAHDCHGLCKTHNKQVRSGKPLTAIKYIQKDPDVRFLQYIAKADGCWLWTSELNKSGYGRFSYNGKRVFAHCHAYALWVGEVPQGSSVAHICRNKSCCNPEHLLVVAGKGGRSYNAVRDMLEARIAELEKENEDLRKRFQMWEDKAVAF